MSHPETDRATMVRRPSVGRFYEQAPALEEGETTWALRAANFVTLVSEVCAGTTFEREDQPDEYLLLLTPGVAATISAGAETMRANGDTLAIVPAGNSRITFHSPGTVVRVFSCLAADMLALAHNAAVYEAMPNDVAPLVPWPAPPGGGRLRVYPLDHYSGGNAFGRIFRSSNLMINIFERQTRRRDTAALTPHSHEAFEQASLTLAGSFVHHLRVPWGPDLAQWRDDEHVAVDSPSLLVIPTNMIHTTRDVGEGETWLIDIFAPPRTDFMLKPGWIRNEADYPCPDALIEPQP